MFSQKKKPKPLLRQRQHRRRVLLVYGAVLGGILLVVGLIFLLRYEKIQITDVRIHGGEHITHADAEETVSRALAGAYVWVLPKSSVLIYPKDEITEDISEQFPRVKEVELNRDFFQGLDVTLHEYDPFGLWCTGFSGVFDPVSSTSTLVREEEECYYLDEEGYLFAEAPVFSDAVYFKYYGGKEEDILRTYVLDPEYFKELVSFRKSVEDLGLPSTSVVINDDDTFVIMLEGGGYLMLDEHIPLTVSFDNLVSIVRDPETELSPLSEKRDQIEYIDLRYHRKVYYKIEE